MINGVAMNESDAGAHRNAACCGMRVRPALRRLRTMLLATPSKEHLQDRPADQYDDPAEEDPERDVMRAHYRACRYPISNSTKATSIASPTLTNPNVTMPSCHCCPEKPADAIGVIAFVPNVAAINVTSQLA